MIIDRDQLIDWKHEPINHWQNRLIGTTLLTPYISIQ